MHEDGAIWRNDSWKPSTRSRSSIGIFNFQASCLATNASQTFRPSEPDSRPDPRAKAQEDVQILSGPEPEPRPSTSRGVFATRSFNGAKPKRKLPKKPPPPKKSKLSRPHPAPPVGNSSPPDDVLGPDLILDVQDEERFEDDSDLEVLSRSSASSDRVLVIPSPTYRMQATSDVSTEILSPRCSPEYTGLSDYSEYPSPDYGCFVPNPLAEKTWDSSDSE